MSSHIFPDRLRLLRHDVRRICREDLARKLRDWAAKLPDCTDELTAVTPEDIRHWERGTSAPSAHVKRLVARILGFRHELLDPESPDSEVSPEGFLRVAKTRGLSGLQITHFWKVVAGQALFKGNPTSTEWVSIIERATGILPEGSQQSLFFGEFWCTHCGFWDAETHPICPGCGSGD